MRTLHRAARGGLTAARRLLSREEGVSLVEYALLLGLLSLAVFAAHAALGSSLRAFFESLANYLASVS